MARDNRSRLARGEAPLSARERRKLERHVPVPKQYTPTVRDIAALAYEQAVKDNRWTHEKNVRAWTTRYMKHVDPVIGEIPIDRVDKRDLRDLLAGILTKTPETGKAVKDILNLIFDHAEWEGYIADNPVRQIPRSQLPSTPAQQHFKALPYTQVAGALGTLDNSDASLTNKLAVRLLALTAVRSRSVRLATWDQFDLDNAVWRIPETLMKSREQFSVPLSKQALEVLRIAKALNPNSELVFPNERGTHSATAHTASSSASWRFPLLRTASGQHSPSGRTAWRRPTSRLPNTLSPTWSEARSAAPTSALTSWRNGESSCRNGLIALETQRLSTWTP